MPEQLLYRFSGLTDFILITAVLLAGAVIGVLVGLRNRPQFQDRSEIGTIQASVLGMLALLLGFTFATASSRYDLRRQLAVEEANALGTTFLRAQMMPEPYRTSLSKSLARYVDLRLEIVSAFREPPRAQQIRAETEDLQKRMWKDAVAIEKADTHSVIGGLFVVTLNQTIDLYSSWIAALKARVPDIILWTLISIAFIAMIITGFASGLYGQKSWVILLVLAVIISGVVVMIVDIDRPYSGPTRVSTHGLEDLRTFIVDYSRD